MPVRRVGGATGSVFAYTHELDDWLRNRHSFFEDQATEISPVLVPTASVEGRLDSEKPHRCADVPDTAREESEALVALARKMWRVLSYSSLSRVAQTFRQAIDQDCTSAAAFAGLSAALTVDSLLGGPESQDAFASAKAALRRAMELDPDFPEAVCMSGWIKILEKRDRDSAHLALQTARRERRLTARSLVGLGLLHVSEGKVEEASACFHQASQQSALNTIYAEFNCWGMYLAGDFPGLVRLIAQDRSIGRSGPLLDAIEAMVLVLTGQPISKMEKLRGSSMTGHPNPVLLGVLGYAYAATEQRQKAEELLGQLKTTRLSEQNHYAVALILLGLRRDQEAVERLRLSYEAGSLWSLAFRSDPMLHRLSGCEQFCGFIRSVNRSLEAGEVFASEEPRALSFAEKKVIQGEHISSGRHTARYRSRKI